MALIAATALRSMHGFCTRPATGSQVRPRLCSIPISAAFPTWRGEPPSTSASPPAADGVIGAAGELRAIDRQGEERHGGCELEGPMPILNRSKALIVTK
jgi:hypothetical protein